MEKVGIGRALRRKVGAKPEFLAELISRPSGSSLMMNISRQKVFEHLCNYPCCNLRSVARALNFSPQTARWHLLRLMEGDFIVEKTHKNRKIFYPKYLIDSKDIKIFDLMNQRNARLVYLAIQDETGISQKVLYEKLGISQQLASLTLKSLENFDLITSNKVGKHKRYKVTNKLEDVRLKMKNKREKFVLNLIQRLKEDGVNPSITGSSKNYLTLRLEIARSKSSTIKIAKNPLNCILRAK